jgi:8-oxo-dGTP pyrophosphatase MutT (NUDIX family)
MPDGGRYARRSARVLLLDGADRLLLFRSYQDYKRPDLGQCWFTPGGGVDDGEPLNVAAARELREETGLRVAPEELGSPVAVTSGHAEFPWASGWFRDDFFHYRVDAHEVDGSGWNEVERRHITMHRWWTLDELTGTAETVYPYGLADLLTDLLAGRFPVEPVRLPWHHQQS